MKNLVIRDKKKYHISHKYVGTFNGKYLYLSIFDYDTLMSEPITLEMFQNYHENDSANDLRNELFELLDTEDLTFYRLSILRHNEAFNDEELWID